MATKTNPETRQPSFSLEEMNKIIGEQVLAALAKQAAAFEAALAERAAKPKNDQSSKNAWAAQKAFKKSGYKDAEPGKDILTFNRWVALGLRPKEGEKAKKINNLRLFHRDLCRPLTAEEAKGFKEKLAAKTAAKPAKAAKVVPIATSPQA